MNKLIPLIFFIIISGCSNHNKFEKCADSMFLLTNELMTKRMPSEAKSSDEIYTFNTKLYNEKIKYEFYLALVKICEMEYSKDPKKFSEDYE